MKHPCFMVIDPNGSVIVVRQGVLLPSAIAVAENILTNHYHAAVWIDHHEARVFHFNATDVDEIVVHPEHPTRHIHHRANSIGSGHTSEDHAFFQDVISAIGTASAILVTGPANAKTELIRSEEHTSELQSRLHLVCRLLLEKKKK